MPPVETLSADSIAERMTRWRPLPASLHAMLALRQQDSAAEARLVEIVGADPELDRRMHVLGRQAPNLQGRGQSAAGEAIRQIGYRRVHSGAVATLIIDTLAAGANELDFLDFWRHSAACAALSASIADAERSEARDLAYAAGMLSRVGLLALDMAAPSSLAALYDAVMDEGWSERLEEAVLGFTVREVTAALHVKWRLPIEMSEAHLVQHQSPLWASRPVARVLWDSTRAVESVGIPDPLYGDQRIIESDGVPAAARRVLDRYFEGGANLMRRSESLIGACLLARDGEI